MTTTSSTSPMGTPEPHSTPGDSTGDSSGPRGVGPGATEPAKGHDFVPSILLGDRLCARCKLNLTGQPIVPEERYGLMVVHCPHCGQVAPVEAYPPLTRWVGRWAMLVAAIWMLVLLALAIGSLIFLFAMTMAATLESTETYEHHLRQSFEVWEAATYPDGESPRFSTRQVRFAEFWAGNADRLNAEHPPLSLAWIELDEFALLLVPAGAAFVLGGVWSILLLGRRRIVVAVAAWGILGAILAVMGVIWLWTASIAMTGSEHVAMVRLVFPIVVGALPVHAVLFTLGIALGRPLVRGLVRAFLPPRMRGPLAALWTADGRPAPRPGPTA